jgi:hypothetical protein
MSIRYEGIEFDTVEELLAYKKAAMPAAKQATEPAARAVVEKKVVVVQQRAPAHKTASGTRWSDADKAQALALFDAGKNRKAIARALGRSVKAVQIILNKNGRYRYGKLADHGAALGRIRDAAPLGELTARITAYAHEHGINPKSAATLSRRHSSKRFSLEAAQKVGVAKMQELRARRAAHQPPMKRDKPFVPSRKHDTAVVVPAMPALPMLTEEGMQLFEQMLANMVANGSRIGYFDMQHVPSTAPWTPWAYADFCSAVLAKSKDIHEAMHFKPGSYHVVKREDGKMFIQATRKAR